MSLHVSISYQPGSLEDLKKRLLQSMKINGTKTATCKSAHRRGYSHGFIDQAWRELEREGLVSQPDYGKPWELTDKGRSAVEEMEGSDAV